MTHKEAITTPGARHVPFAAGLAMLRQAHANTIATGLSRVDWLGVGLGPGELWVVYPHRVSVPTFLVQMACRVTALGHPVALLSRERPSVDLWRLVVAEWCELAPADVGRATLTDEQNERYLRAKKIALKSGLAVSGCEIGWSIEEEASARVVLIDRPEQFWPDDESQVLTADMTRDFARRTGATVMVGVYDDRNLATWKRYADTFIQMSGPIDGWHKRVGEVDCMVSSRKHMTRGKFEIWWRQSGQGRRVHLSDTAAGEDMRIDNSGFDFDQLELE